jgi:hypothetical protein
VQAKSVVELTSWTMTKGDLIHQKNLRDHLNVEYSAQ